MNWQPIETVPKDGTEILAVNGYGDCKVTQWRNGGLILPNGYGWTTIGDAAATHWMTLPEPPKGTTTETRQGVARAKDETL